MSFKTGGVGNQFGDSIGAVDPKLLEQAQSETIARILAASRSRPQIADKKVRRVVKAILSERTRHQRERAGWQKRIAAHQRKMDKLIRQLKEMRAGGGEKPTPRVAGKTRRKIMARRMALRSIR